MRFEEVSKNLFEKKPLFDTYWLWSSAWEQGGTWLLHAANYVPRVGLENSGPGGIRSTRVAVAIGVPVGHP